MAAPARALRPRAGTRVGGRDRVPPAPRSSPRSTSSWSSDLPDVRTKPSAGIIAEICRGFQAARFCDRAKKIGQLRGRLPQRSLHSRIECAEKPGPILLVSGAGPRVFSPSSRRCRAISRPASAFPIFASVHCLPVGETTRAPFLRQRDASGISEVTQMSTAEMCSAIQSSAASAVSPTRTILTFEVPGGRIGREPLETTKTLSRRRAATR